jgi:hypothetical protein
MSSPRPKKARIPPPDNENHYHYYLEACWLDIYLHLAIVIYSYLLLTIDFSLLSMVCLQLARTAKQEHGLSYF